MEKRYYKIEEITKEQADMMKEHGVYEKDGKFYTLGWGHQISTLGPDRKTILFNTEIEGVIEADNDEDAMQKFGIEMYK